MGKESCRMQPRPQHSNTRHADQWEDLKRDGKAKSTTSSRKKMTRGSKRRKIETDGKKWKVNMQLQQHIPKSLLCLRSRPLTKDQADFEWQGMQGVLPRSLPCLRSKECTKAILLSQRKKSPEGLMSANHYDTRVCHAFSTSLLFSTESEGSAVLLTQFLLQLSPFTQACP